MNKFVPFCLCLAVLSLNLIACGSGKPVVTDDPKPVEKNVTEPIKKVPTKPIKTALDVYYDAYEKLVRCSIYDSMVAPTVQCQREAMKILNPYLSEKEKYRMEKKIGSDYDYITYDLRDLITTEREKLPYDDNKYLNMYKKTLDFLNEREKKNGKLTSADCTDALFVLMRNGEDLDRVYGTTGYNQDISDPKEFKFSIDDSLEFWKKNR